MPKTRRFRVYRTSDRVMRVTLYERGEIVLDVECCDINSAYALANSWGKSL